MVKYVRAATTDDMLKAFETKLDRLTSSGDIDAATEIKCAVDLSEDEIARLYEVVDKYNTSVPVSGDWATETEDEQRTIAKEFNVSLDEAKQIMIDILGFEPDDTFVEACDSIMSASDSLSDRKVEITEDDKDVVYQDEGGGFGGTGNEILTLAEIKTYWNENNEDDPVLAEYDSFNEWFGDTVSNFLRQI